MHNIGDYDTQIYNISILSCSNVKSYTLYTLKITGRTRFMLQNKCTLEPTMYHICVRYSEMLELHRTLIAEYSQYFKSNNKFLPLFPPKKYFNRTTTEFISKRKAELNKYFTDLFENFPNVGASELLIKFCSPLKMDIIICGAHNSAQSLYLEALLQQLKREAEEFSCFKSSPPKFLSSQDTQPDEPMQEEHLPSSKNQMVDMYPSKSTFFSYINSDRSLASIFPYDYIFHDYVFRLDVNEQVLAPNVSELSLANRIKVWIENQASLVVSVDLSNFESLKTASDIIRTLKNLNDKKLWPSFVVMGLLNPNKIRQISEDDIINSIILQPTLMQIKYIEVNISTGENIIEPLHHLLWLREKKEYD